MDAENRDFAPAWQLPKNGDLAQDALEYTHTPMQAEGELEILGEVLVKSAVSKSLFDGQPLADSPAKLRGKHRVGGRGSSHRGSHWDGSTGDLFALSQATEARRRGPALLPRFEAEAQSPTDGETPEIGLSIVGGKAKLGPISPAPALRKTVREVHVPPALDRAMKAGGTLAISISGGKDSQALLEATIQTYQERGWAGHLFAIHADLGKAEWPQTEAHVRKMCEAHGIPLTVVQRAKGGLVERMEERMEKVAQDAQAAGTDPKPFWPSSKARYCTSHLKSGPIDQHLRQVSGTAPQDEMVGEAVNQASPETGSAKPKPFWPSSSNRYCTSDLKRGPIDIQLRNHSIIVSAEGVRASESAERAKKPVCEVRDQITASSKDAAKNLSAMSPLDALDAQGEGQRVALDWRPIHEWSDEDVWNACGTSTADLKRRQALYKQGYKEEALDGWPCHPAYVFGNSRLSCVFCVLGSKNDLETGARHNPELYREYLDMEKRGKATFKHKFSLADLEAFKDIDQSDPLAKAVGISVSGAILVKSHVRGYARQDGTFVHEHEDKRQPLQPTPAMPFTPQNGGRTIPQLESLPEEFVAFNTHKFQKLGKTLSKPRASPWPKARFFQRHEYPKPSHHPPTFLTSSHCRPHFDQRPLR